MNDHRSKPDGRGPSLYFGPMRQADRLSVILEELSDGGSVNVTDLCGRLGVSAATIRRDLALLEENRLLKRTHGGAVTQGLLYELPLRYKSARHQEEKRRIARAVVELIPEGASIGLTGGTTTTEVARALIGRQELTIVTNALNIASELAVRPNLRLVVTGGMARSASYELVGPLAEASLGEINLDVAVMGVDGISAEAGLTTHHEVEAHTNLALIERARRVIVATDGSKIGHAAFARICPIERVNDLITDTGAERTALTAIAAAGVRITTV
jgi:DeoR family transcriptional regulator, aga operon transcriptional repressor